MCRSTVVGPGHIKWSEHTGQYSCIYRSCVVGPGDVKWSEHTEQCPCICRGTVVTPGDIELSEHTGQCSCMCRCTVVGPGDIKWSEHTGKMLLHGQKCCDWSRGHYNVRTHRTVLTYMQKLCGRTRVYESLEDTEMMLLHIYRSSVVGAGGRRHHTMPLHVQRHCGRTRGY